MTESRRRFDQARLAFAEDQAWREDRDRRERFEREGRLSRSHDACARAHTVTRRSTVADQAGMNPGVTPTDPEEASTIPTTLSGIVGTATKMTWLISTI
ncbi:hypothetical protein KC318_g16960 [Hortaea werneckii]|nr:hypothetical protein KC334_g13764 [Hortaea werneckii]KAI6926097.1 hypothetical protein KC355_g16770 [Hortaea werneckii]KAI7649728.1 hypothetical protein KC318_g16960 [Hortaea werneckii]